MIAKSPPRRRPPAPPTIEQIEIWSDGQPITDWPGWVAAQRAAGWPPRAIEALRLLVLPESCLNLHAVLDAGQRGELHG